MAGGTPDDFHTMVVGAVLPHPQEVLAAMSLDWQPHRRSWTELGDLGWTRAALTRAQMACQARDLAAMFEAVDLALVATVVLDPDATSWPEVADAERSWRLIGLAANFPVPESMVERLCDHLARRLAIIDVHLDQVAADRAAVADLEHAMEK